MTVRDAALWLAAALSMFAAQPALALDPPMDSSNGIDCLDCHTPHSAEGDTLTQVEGNPNLCMSCHNSTGLASAKPFADADQAYPGTIGTSHRFDSGPSGHAEPRASNTSTGTVTSGGAFTGRIERSYTISMTAGGNVGTATYAWTDTAGNSGVGITGTNKTLADGVTVSFANGTSPSFTGGDVFTVYVRTDLRLPSESSTDELQLALRLENGNKVVCSTCHNQHSQEKTPADASAPAYSGTGTGAGRHYQRADNNTNQMCLICHSSRNVSNSDDGSHPINVSVGAGVPSTYFQSPATLSTIGGRVYCTTCHSPHYATSGGANGGLGDGYLLDDSIGALRFAFEVERVVRRRVAARVAGDHRRRRIVVRWHLAAGEGRRRGLRRRRSRVGLDVRAGQQQDREEHASAGGSGNSVCALTNPLRTHAPGRSAAESATDCFWPPWPHRSPAAQPA